MHLFVTKNMFWLHGIVSLYFVKTLVSLRLIGFIIDGVPKVGLGVGIWDTFSIVFFARFYPRALSNIFKWSWNLVTIRYSNRIS